jgi:hypothetical protein
MQTGGSISSFEKSAYFEVLVAPSNVLFFVIVFLLSAVRLACNYLLLK